MFVTLDTCFFFIDKVHAPSLFNQRPSPAFAPPTSLPVCRPIMTKLVSVDILGDPLDTDVEIQHPDGQPFMLAFVNIAANASVLAADGGSVLKSALTFLSNNLHERGTIVIALPDWEFPRTMLKGIRVCVLLLVPVEWEASAFCG